MLEPAIAHRDELVSLFAKEIYSDDYFYYVGYPHWFGIPEIGTASGDEGWNCDVRWAILDDEKVIGYFAYRIDSIFNSIQEICSFICLHTNYGFFLYFWSFYLFCNILGYTIIDI